jgi:N-acetylglutamate synthase-like GNAT family acetyltransferase
VIEITTDLGRIDLDKLEQWLNVTYWAEGRPREVVERSVQNSLNFSAFIDGEFIGFARVVTDSATFGWVCDVVVEEKVRGQGVGKQLMKAIIEHPDLKGIKRLLLATLDAHGLYSQYGFIALPNPERWMAKMWPGA